MSYYFRVKTPICFINKYMGTSYIGYETSYYSPISKQIMNFKIMCLNFNVIVYNIPSLNISTNIHKHILKSLFFQGEVVETCLSYILIVCMLLNIKPVHLKFVFIIWHMFCSYKMLNKCKGKCKLYNLVADYLN